MRMSSAYSYLIDKSEEIAQIFDLKFSRKRLFTRDADSQHQMRSHNFDASQDEFHSARSSGNSPRRAATALLPIEPHSFSIFPHVVEVSATNPDVGANPISALHDPKANRDGDPYYSEVMQDKWSRAQNTSVEESRNKSAENRHSGNTAARMRFPGNEISSAVRAQIPDKLLEGYPISLTPFERLCWNVDKTGYVQDMMVLLLRFAYACLYPFMLFYFLLRHILRIGLKKICKIPYAGRLPNAKTRKIVSKHHRRLIFTGGNHFYAAGVATALFEHYGERLKDKVSVEGIGSGAYIAAYFLSSLHAVGTIPFWVMQCSLKMVQDSTSSWSGMLPHCTTSANLYAEGLHFYATNETMSNSPNSPPFLHDGSLTIWTSDTSNLRSLPLREDLVTATGFANAFVNCSFLPYNISNKAVGVLRPLHQFVDYFISSFAGDDTVSTVVDKKGRNCRTLYIQTQPSVMATCNSADGHNEQVKCYKWRNFRSADHFVWSGEQALKAFLRGYHAANILHKEELRDKMDWFCSQEPKAEVAAARPETPVSPVETQNFYVLLLLWFVQNALSPLQGILAEVGAMLSMKTHPVARSLSGKRCPRKVSAGSKHTLKKPDFEKDKC